MKFNMCKTCTKRVSGTCKEPRYCEWKSDLNRPEYYVPNKSIPMTCPWKDSCISAGADPICFEDFENDGAKCGLYKDKEETLCI